MEAKKLFGYAAAMSLLAFGFASCNPDEQKEDPAPGPSTTVRFTVNVTEVTQTTAKAEITVRGDENATWYAFVTDNTDTEAEDLITSAVGELNDIGSVLKTGNDEVEFTGLKAGTDYRVIVTGLAADGTVSGRAADEGFTTERDPNVWNANPDWTIEYVDRGSFEVQGGTMYGDLINITVADGNLDYYYVTALSESDFSSRYNNSVATLANSVIEELNAIIEENNEMYPESPASILDLLYTGSASLIMEPLDNEAQYLFMIGIQANGLFGEGLGLYAQSERFTPAVEESSEAFKAWLGEYTISGTYYDDETDEYGNITSTTEVECTNVLNVVERIPNYEYVVYGWQQGIFDEDNIGLVARFNSSDNTMSIYSSNDLGQVDTGVYGTGTVYFLGFVAGSQLGQGYGRDVRITGGEYPIATLSMEGDNVTLTPLTIGLTGGITAKFTGMEYYTDVIYQGQKGTLTWLAQFPRFDEEFTIVKGNKTGTSSISPVSILKKSSLAAGSTAHAAGLAFPITSSYMVK